MAQRKQVGLFFSYNERWIAGTYYILNIVHALYRLNKDERPEIVIITEDYESFNRVKLETKYPFLKFQKYPLEFPTYSKFERFINAIGLKLFKKKFIAKTKQPTIDFLYPNEVEGVHVKGIPKVNWIPDLQELYLPELFSEKEIEGRKKFYETVVLKGDVAVFSSKDSEKDFKNLYPNASIQTEVLPFAVTHPDFSNINLLNLLNKYLLPSKYFFVPNQFWAHKNHMIVLEAVKILKDQGIEVHIAFSGKELDFRNQNYVQNLKKYVCDHHLKDQIHFLGFLDRKVQLCLMKHAISIVQPSLFEGWSTVVEDAKALNAYILLSKIPVHVEQCSKNVTFFNPKKAPELASLLAKYDQDYPSIEPLDYHQDIQTFGLKFNSLVAQYTIS